jgi:DNA invertase Pin-like site-specific DNA recombinase
MKIGYARVSSSGQSLALQLDELRAAGCEKIYQEKESGGSRVRRQELERALDQLRPGDELVVTRLDRLARSVPDLYAIVQQITDAQATFSCLQQSAIDTGTAAGKLMLAVLAAVAEFERDLILDRQRAGIAAAKARGAYRGGKATIDRERVLEAFERNQRSATATAKELNIGRASVYRILGSIDELEHSTNAVLHGAQAPKEH